MNRWQVLAVVAFVLLVLWATVGLLIMGAAVVDAIASWGVR